MVLKILCVWKLNFINIDVCVYIGFVSKYYELIDWFYLINKFSYFFLIIILV